MVELLVDEAAVLDLRAACGCGREDEFGVWEGGLDVLLSGSAVERCGRWVRGPAG